MSAENTDGLITIDDEIIDDFDVDLTEFATALRTFPDTILKAVLGIYHKQEAVKKQVAKGFVQNALNLSKGEDKFEANELFQVEEYLKVNSFKLPTHFQQQHLYKNVNESLQQEPHFQYAFHHLLDQELVSIEPTCATKPYQPVPLSDDLYHRAKLAMKKKNSIRQSVSSTSNTERSFRASTRESNADSTFLDAQFASSQRNSTHLAASPQKEELTDDSSKRLSFDENTFGESFRESIVQVDSCSIDQFYNLYGDDFVSQVPNRLLSIYDTNYQYTSLEQKACNRKPLDVPYQVSTDKKVLVVAENLQLDVGNFEPIFISMFLLDISTNRRVSEYYHCTFNVEGKVTNKLNVSEEMKNLLRSDRNNRPHAVFTVADPSPFIYLVVLGEKILQQGGIPDLYHKKPKKTTGAKKEEENVKQSVIDKLKEAYETLEQFREPLFWSCKPLFKTSKSQSEIKREINAHTNSPTEPQEIHNPKDIAKVVGKTIKNRVSFSGQKDNEESFQKIREEMFVLNSGPQSFRKLFPLSAGGKEKFRFAESIFQLMDGSKRKVVKNLDGVFLVSVKDVTDEADAEAIAFDDEDPVASEEERKVYEDRCEKRPKALRSNEVEIEDDYHSVLNSFHQVTPFIEKAVSPFHLKYFHTLYIYLDNCNFSHIGGKDARNIAVRAILRDSDKEPEVIDGLQMFESRYSRNYPNGRLMVNYDVSSVSYHQKYPQYFNEFKVQLPVTMTKAHHIVFEFYHVNCQVVKKKTPTKKQQPQHEEDQTFGNASVNILGYSVLRLIQDETCIKDGYSKLPVYKKLTADYLSHLSELETYNTSKSVFRFNIQLKSTTYPQDHHALGFLSQSRQLLVDKNSELSSFFSKMLLPRATANMDNFKLAKWEEIVPYSPSFINLILYCMSNMKGPNPRSSSTGDVFETISQCLNVSFETLLALLRGVYKKVNSSERYDTRDTVLSTYVQHFFKNPGTFLTPVYQAVAERWDAFFDFYNKKEAERKAALLHDDVPDVSSKDAKRIADQKKVKIEEEPKNLNIVQRRLRSISVFKRKNAALTNLLSGTDYQEPVSVRDSLQLSWFLFDLIVKSIILEVKSGAQTDFAMFFTSIRSVQRRVIENLIDLQNVHDTKKGGSPADAQLAQKVNLNIALFIRDLLSIAHLPNMRDTKFRTYVFDMLEDYMLSTQIKISSSFVRMRLEFVEIIFDHEYIIEFAANSTTKFVTNFMIDVLLKALKERESKDKAVAILTQLLTKFDYSAEYQDDGRRNAISQVFAPFLENLIADFDQCTKDMKTNTTEKLSVVILHLFRNYEQEHWSSIWLARTPVFLSNFVKLMSLTLLTLAPYSQIYLRTSAKILTLEVMNSFISSMRDKMKAEAGVYSHVLEETILFFVKFLDQSKDDIEITEQLFIPAFCELIKFFARTISMSALDNRWKWAMGAILKFGEFPFKLSNIVYYECMMALMDPLEPRLQEYSGSVEKFTIEDDTDKNIVIDDKSQIKGATLDKLIERITSDSKGFDMKLIEVFFLTYRSFTKPYILMDKLIQRFDIAKRDKDTNAGLKVTLRVSNAIKSWVDKYFHDFDNILICRLVQFLEETAEIDNFRSYCGNLKKSLSTKLIKDDEKVSRSVMFRENEVPTPILPKGFTPYVKFQLMDWSSVELARQITYMEAEYFKKIEPKECLSQGWAKKNKYLLAPNIAALTDRWNNMTYYVVHTIIFEDDLKVRKSYINKFVEIGMELHKLNNLNGVTEIVSGLAHVSIHRLKKTWDAVDQTTTQNLKMLQDLCNQQQANKSMRDALKRVYGPCVPPLSMYLKDLTFIEDGNPDLIGDGALINVFKRRQIAQIIQKIKNYQQTPYPIEPIPYIRDNFHSSLFKTIERDEDKLWERSIKIEPREKKP